MVPKPSSSKQLLGDNTKNNESSSSSAAGSTVTGWKRWLMWLLPSRMSLVFPGLIVMTFVFNIRHTRGYVSYYTSAIDTLINDTFSINASVTELRKDLVAMQGNEDEATATHSNTLQNEAEQRPRFAYAFTVAGCTATSCKGYVLNAVVTAGVLREYSSLAKYNNTDVVLMVRMSADTQDTRLDAELEAWLRKAGVRVAYLAKLDLDNFGTTTLEKFRVLELTEYDRVLFMDSDIAPACPLDYLFEMSYTGKMAPFVGMAGSAAPITASTFLVTPQEGLFQSVMDLYHNRPNKTKFDRTIGWGHVHHENDYWESWWWKRRTYGFKGAEFDQGMLYTFFKYVVMNYTKIMNVGRIEEYREVKVNSTFWKNHQVGKDIFHIPMTGKYQAKISKRKLDMKEGCGCGALQKTISYTKQVNGTLQNVTRTVNYPPIREMFGNEFFLVDKFHFPGGKKPWKEAITLNRIPKNRERVTKMKSFWLYHLGQANKTFELNMPSTIQKGGGKPAHGAGHESTHLFNKDGSSVRVPEAGGWYWADDPTKTLKAAHPAAEAAAVEVRTE